MAVHTVTRPSGPVMRRFTVIEPFDLDIPQPDGSTARQHYRAGMILSIRVGNEFLNDAIFGDGGMASQGKAQEI